MNTTTREPADVAAEKIANFLDEHDRNDINHMRLIIRAAYAERDAAWITERRDIEQIIAGNSRFGDLRPYIRSIVDELNALQERDAAVAELVKAAKHSLPAIFAASRVADGSDFKTLAGHFAEIHQSLKNATYRLTAPAPQPCPYGFDDKTGFFISELANVAASSEPTAKRLAAIRELERRVREEGGGE